MGYGRRLYAVGTNRSVAVLSGIRADRTVIAELRHLRDQRRRSSASCSGDTRTCPTRRSGRATTWIPSPSPSWEGPRSAAGSGSVGGTIIGAVIILVLTNLSLLMGFPIQSQMVIKGLVIVLALWLNTRRAK